MKIEICYDHIRPYTFVMIEGKPVSQSDIYGFLYPVRGYVLQTWLNPSGSWRGLKNEMMDLTREEPSRLVFYGREIDYLDLERALNGLLNCQCQFVYADYTDVSVKYLAEAEKCFENIVNTPVVMDRDDSDTTRTMAELFPEQKARITGLVRQQEREWLSTINTQSDFFRCAKDDGCCLINGDRILSYDNYGMIDTLMTGLRRSPDMIVVAFASDEKKADFINFNTQYKNHTVTFVRSDEAAWKETLRVKYGVPWEYRKRLERLRRCYNVLTSCFLTEEDENTGDEVSSMSSHIRNAIRKKYKKRWAAHQKNQMDRLYSLLYGIDYIKKGVELNA
ncbi:MAG: hypothetical protein IJ899_10355 [Blautia sp.]|nr:hypothetical protein [Blautia sp.]